MARVVFFCKDTIQNIELFEYYKQDVDSLKSLGHEVIIVNRYKDLPFKFDFIFIWWWTYAFFPVFLCKLLRKPSIVTGTFNFRFPIEFQGKDFFSRPWWQKRLISYSVKNANLNLFVNKFELNQCTEYFQLNNAEYFPHVVDNDYINRSVSKKKFELFNICWSGKENLIRKGVPCLLEAIALLKKDGKSFKLNLAGKKGDGYNYLEDRIKELNLINEVILLGEISKEEKLLYLNQCDLYVQPSNFEGFGLAIAEAMASGACVITCNVGAVGAVVGDSGIFVTPNDPKQLADKILELYYNRGKIVEYQKKALDRAQNKFSFDSKVKSLTFLVKKYKLIK